MGRPRADIMTPASAVNVTLQWARTTASLNAMAKVTVSLEWPLTGTSRIVVSNTIIPSQWPSATASRGIKTIELSSRETSSSTASMSHSPPSNLKGEIIGSIFGGIFFLVLITLTGIWFWQRRKRRARKSKGPVLPTQETALRATFTDLKIKHLLSPKFTDPYTLILPSPHFLARSFPPHRIAIRTEIIKAHNIKAVTISTKRSLPAEKLTLSGLLPIKEMTSTSSTTTSSTQASAEDSAHYSSSPVTKPKNASPLDPAYVKIRAHSYSTPQTALSSPVSSITDIFPSNPTTPPAPHSSQPPPPPPVTLPRSTYQPKSPRSSRTPPRATKLKARHPNRLHVIYEDNRSQSRRESPVLGELNLVKIWSSDLGSQRDNQDSLHSQRTDRVDANGEVEGLGLGERLRKQVYGSWGVEV